LREIRSGLQQEGRGKPPGPSFADQTNASSSAKCVAT
jgi:hypothetical protein